MKKSKPLHLQIRVFNSDKGVGLFEILKGDGGMDAPVTCTFTVPDSSFEPGAYVINLFDGILKFFKRTRTIK